MEEDGFFQGLDAENDFAKREENLETRGDYWLSATEMFCISIKYCADAKRALDAKENEVALQRVVSAAYSIGLLQGVIMLDGDEDRKSSVKRFLPLFQINRAKFDAKNRAQQIVSEIICADTQQQKRITEIADETYRMMINEGYTKGHDGLPETVSVLADWVRSVVPDYAKKGGRPRKTP